MNAPIIAGSSNRRDFLRAAGTVAGSLLSLGALGVAGAAGQPARKTPPAAAKLPAALPRAITVYKDPDCGCCKLWVEHMRGAGFTPTVHDTGDMASVKAAMGVPASLGSCHTARVGNYTIEGHVPADVIERLLREQPAAQGLAVPGMPMGSPGMEGGRKDKYDVLLFDKSGKSRVFASR